MQGVAIIVGTEVVDLACDIYLRILNAVGIAANAGAIVGRRVDGVNILSDIVIAKHHIRCLAVLIRHADGYHTSAIIGQADFHTLAVGQRDKFHFLAIEGRIKISRVESRRCQRHLSATGTRGQRK